MRWGPSTSQNGPGGLPTAITASMTAEQLDAYVLDFRIQGISQKLVTGDIFPANRARCPSPEPEYDRSGRRTNTRPQRYRKLLEDERHNLIETAVNTILGYQLPRDYRRPSVFRNKVFIPVTDFPGVNFIGQILGPRGSSLKAMNTESGAAIAIRGKGSVKEGKGQITDDQNEPLHCLITGSSQRKIDMAKELVQKVIEAAITTPEHDNERKRQQLRELAMLNGTFRDDENQAMESRGTRLIAHVENTPFQQPPQPSTQQSIAADQHVIDREYAQLMSEISGEDRVGTNNVSEQEATRLPPWRVDSYRKKGWIN